MNDTKKKSPPLMEADRAAAGPEDLQHEALRLEKVVWPLLVWYDGSHRDLAWRRTKDPYRIWVSEIMLQQTRVEAVKGYYDRFTAELPDVESLAACPQERLLKLWEGLGYYSRVRNMQKAARVILAEHGGSFPGEPDVLLTLPGIGDYTAGAIASIAFDAAVPAVDGNVMRIVSRLCAYREDILLPRTKTAIRSLLQDVIDRFPDICRTLREEREDPKKVQRLLRPSVFNQALMELGALICLPAARADCERCPWVGACRAFADGLTQEIPVRIPKTSKRIEEKTILLIHCRDGYAIRQRPENGLLAGMYEFPSMEGKVSAQEAAAYVGELGLKVQGEAVPLADAKHVFSHIIWEMSGYFIEAERAEEAGTSGGASRGRKLLANQTESGIIFAVLHEIRTRYALPGAFSPFLKYLR